MVGVSLNKYLLQAHCIISNVGFNLCFFPMHYFGLCGLPRRVCVYEGTYNWINTICSVGSLISAFSGCFFVFILWDSIANRKVVLGFYGPSNTITNLFCSTIAYHNKFFTYSYTINYDYVGLLV